MIPSEDFGGKLFKNSSSSNFLKISYWYIGVPPAI